MNGDMLLDRHLSGTGLVIGARARLDAFPVGSDVCFADSCDVAELRIDHPEWRSVPLAPVELLDPAGKLAEVADGSINFVIDWAMVRDADRAAQRLGAAARVLRPGGVLVLPMGDSRFIEIDAEVESIFAGLERLAERLQPRSGSFAPQRQRREWWPFARFATVITAFAADYAAWFELEQVQRYGRYNLALLRRRSEPPVEGRKIIASGGHCYALDGPFLRHITSMKTLTRLQAAHVPMIGMSVAEQALFVAGSPLNPADVGEFLANTDEYL